MPHRKLDMPRGRCWMLALAPLIVLALASPARGADNPWHGMITFRHLETKGLNTIDETSTFTIPGSGPSRGSVAWRLTDVTPDTPCGLLTTTERGALGTAAVPVEVDTVGTPVQVNVSLEGDGSYRVGVNGLQVMRHTDWETCPFVSGVGYVFFPFPEDNGDLAGFQSATGTDDGSGHLVGSVRLPGDCGNRTGDWGPDGCVVTWDFRAALRATLLSYTGDERVQYSDSAVLSGQLIDDAGAAIDGARLDFTLGTQSPFAFPTGSQGEAAAPVVVLQRPGSTTEVAVDYAGDARHAGAHAVHPFAIAREDCTLGYTGDTLVAPLSATRLSAHLDELDASKGDRSGKLARFTVVDAAGATRTFSATTDANGDAAAVAALPAAVYGVSLAFAGDDFYTDCATATDTLVVVAAAAAKVTGGGWVSTGTGRANFGFNAIPQAGGLYTGQFQLRSNSGKNRFHADSVTSLQSTGTTATWRGTGRWNDATGFGFAVSVVDNGSSGSKKLDTIAVTITGPSGALVFSTEGAQPLKGGNITVHPS